MSTDDASTGNQGGGLLSTAPATITTEAPWQWLAAGWSDIMKNMGLSLGYGLVFVICGMAISVGLWLAGLSAFIPIAAGSFAIIGPLLAAGLYLISKNTSEGKSTTFADITSRQVMPSVHVFYIGFAIFFALYVWLRVAMLIYALFVSGTYMPLGQFSEFVLSTPQGLAMLVVGTIVGGIIAFAMFAVTAFSIPLIMDRKVDAFEAIVLSIWSIRKNTAAMLLWAWLIGILIAVGIATAFLGLVIIFPLLGHATWHAYKDMFPE